MLTVTANLTELTGSVDEGWLTFILVGYATQPRVVGGCIIGEMSVSAHASISPPNGQVSQAIIPNDAITPSGTSYMIEVFNGKGAMVSAGRYSLTGSGSVDLSDLIPL
jgi:hypothetical protein